MKRGKRICKELKAVRRRIADENGIELQQPECTHEGDCAGTCPRCEAEVRYLEQALYRRLSMGRVATVAGLGLSLAACGGSGEATLSVDSPLPVSGISTASGDRDTIPDSQDSASNTVILTGIDESETVYESEGICVMEDDTIISHISTPVEPPEEELVDETEGEAEIVFFPDENPSFPGGEEALYKYLAENVHFPNNEADVTGFVVIKFVVEKDGTITHATVARDIGAGCGQIALQAVNAMPKWIPGKNGGKPVRCQFMLPVSFEVQ